MFFLVEYFDEDFLIFFFIFGEFKLRIVRYFFFLEEGFIYIENGIRVVEFNKII